MIFTVPEELNVFWQFNRREFAELLLKVARQTLDTLLADDAHLGATPGIISVLHTWGRSLSIHPHVHCLVTSGGVDDDGMFVAPKRSILIPARMLKAVFRGRMRDALIRAVRSGRLTVPPQLSVARSVSLFNRLARSEWNTRILESYEHGVSVVGYLARYLGGHPISGRRIERFDADEVVFRYKDHRDGRSKTMTLTTAEFLRRWCEHVPPKGLRMIRRSGLYANCRADDRENIRRQLEQSRPAQCQPSKAAAAGVIPLEPECCPLCNTEVVVRIVVRPVREFDGRDRPAFSLVRPP